MTDYPKWLYKDGEGMIVLTKEIDDTLDETWLSNPNPEFNKRIPTKTIIKQTKRKTSNGS